jgi:murein peptide amidase A
MRFALPFFLLVSLAVSWPVVAAEKPAATTELTLGEQCEALAKRLRVAPKSVCAPLHEVHEMIGSSHRSRPVLARRGGASASDARATRVLVLGAIHGDELTAGWLALQWAAMSPPDGNEFSVLHVPIANPDGVFDAAPSRTNARGVDLNRNFPTPQWNSESVKWWTQQAKRDPRRWPGKAAASELETKNVISLIQSFKPSVIVSIHAPLGVLDYDGGGLPPKRIGSIWLDIVGIYPGSLGHYASRSHGIPVLTVELPHALKTVPQQESERMWTDLFAWVRKYAQHDSSTK